MAKIITKDVGLTLQASVTAAVAAKKVCKKAKFGKKTTQVVVGATALLAGVVTA